MDSTCSSSTDFRLIDKTSIDEIAWDPAVSSHERTLWVPLVKRGVSSYFDNIRGEFKLLQFDGRTLPILVTGDNFDDSYVASVYGHYILLALESMFIVKNRFIRTLTEQALKALGKFIRKGKINHCVFVNHSLFSTDLHSDALTETDIVAVSDYLKKEFPGHAVVFRSLNKQCCPSLLQNLKSIGYNLIASRRVMVTAMDTPELSTARIIKSDLKLWNDYVFEVVDQSQLSEIDEARILDLYQTFAVKNHSKLNPQINSDFIKLLREEPFFTLKAIRRNGTIDGFVGFKQQGATMTCSVFAYDKSCADKTQLYRLMSTLLFLEAGMRASTFHQSSGATFYKSIRRAQSHQEYKAVLISHLPWRQRASWWLLKGVMNTAAVPLMKKY